MEWLIIWAIGYGITEGIMGKRARFLGWPEQLGQWVRKLVENDE